MGDDDPGIDPPPSDAPAGQTAPDPAAGIPQAVLRAWLPHLLMLGLLGLAVWLLAGVFAPIRDPVLLAASLAALTYSSLFLPIHRVVNRLTPFVHETWRRQISATAAALALVTILASPLLLLLLTSLHSVGRTLIMVRGLLMRDPEQVAQALAIADEKIRDIQAMFPDLPIRPEEVHQFLQEALSRSRGSELFGMLLHGTGGFLAQLALAIIVLIFLYDRGPALVRMLLGYSPLTPRQRVILKRRFRHAVLRLLTDTIGVAVVRGAFMGMIAWAIAGVNFYAVAAVAAFVSLIPVVGPVFVWLPLSSLLWSQGHRLEAAMLVVASLAGEWLIAQIIARAVKGLEPHGTWMGLMLFLGLIGGLLSYGAKGLIIGPTAVVILSVLGSFWLPLYGVGKPAPALAPETGPEPTP